MAEKRGRRKIDEFLAYTDDGHGVRLTIYQHYIVMEAFNEPPQTVDTMMEVVSADGRGVNRVSDTEYVLLDPFGDVRVRRRIG